MRNHENNSFCPSEGDDEAADINSEAGSDESIEAFSVASTESLIALDPEKRKKIEAQKKQSMIQEGLENVAGKSAISMRSFIALEPEERKRKKYGVPHAMETDDEDALASVKRKRKLDRKHNLPLAAETEDEATVIISPSKGKKDPTNERILPSKFKTNDRNVLSLQQRPQLKEPTASHMNCRDELQIKNVEHPAAADRPVERFISIKTPKRNITGKGCVLDDQEPEQVERLTDKERSDAIHSAHGKKREGIWINLPALIYPKSQYVNYSYPLPVEKEETILRYLRGEQKGRDRETTEYYYLEDFTVYYPRSPSNQTKARVDFEMTPLSSLFAKKVSNWHVLVDGVILCGDERRYVQGVPIHELSIGTYMDIHKHSVDKNLLVRSAIAKASGVWYRLRKPAATYEAYHKSFLWLANFTKYFIDFLYNYSKECVEETGRDDITLEDFRSCFFKYISRFHAKNRTFKEWLGEYGQKDFRQPVAVHQKWLWSQSCELSQKRLQKFTLWNEVRFLNAIKPATEAVENCTIVTPYVYNCFKDIFRNLEVIVPESKCTPVEIVTVNAVAVPIPVTMHRDEAGDTESLAHQLKPKVGDLITIDEIIQPGKGYASLRYAYVLRIRKDESFQVLWVYRPADTILAAGYYPHENELFLSDHCNCNEKTRLYSTNVVRIPTVEFSVNPGETGAEFFIRQKYRNSDPAFMALRDTNFACLCEKENADAALFDQVHKRYKVGDTVLMEPPLPAGSGETRALLEPVEIHGFFAERHSVSVRILERRGRFEKAPPNELVYSRELVDIDQRYINRRCHIKIFDSSSLISSPYNRNGTGDCFFITSERDEEYNIVPLTTAPRSLRQSSLFENKEPLPGKEALRGLDLFCGAGNFGRGIEEGSGFTVQMKCAVDMAPAALHSYRANLCPSKLETTSLYLGSVNNFLKDAILGNYGSLVPPTHNVDFICAGSPCQGFSNANSRKNTEKGLQNSSLIASVATALEVYRPKYALLENVTGISAPFYSVDDKSHNVLAQLLCCLVGMGYQVQQWIMGSWSYGDCQQRKRIFISIASLDEELPKRPPRSHEDNAFYSKKGHSLYQAPNGKRFGKRETGGICTFPFIKTREAFQDLPDIGSGHLGICIPLPYHIVSRKMYQGERLLISHIPRFPPGLGRREAIDMGTLPKYLDTTNANSKHKASPSCASYSRIYAEGLCRTIVATLAPGCSFTGQWTHYDQPRCLTIQEARRAQGFPDDEVLVGSAEQNFKVVGNSVARSVSFAWGLALHAAYFGNVS